MGSRNVQTIFAYENIIGHILRAFEVLVYQIKSDSVVCSAQLSPTNASEGKISQKNQLIHLKRKTISEHSADFGIERPKQEPIFPYRIDNHRIYQADTLIDIILPLRNQT